MGTQWFRGQRGLTLQRRQIRHSKELGSTKAESGGTGGRVPYKDRFTPGRVTEKDEG